MRVYVIVVFAIAALGTGCRARRLQEENGQRPLGEKNSFRFQEAAASAATAMQSVTLLGHPASSPKNTWRCLDAKFSVSSQAATPSHQSWSANPECFDNYDPRAPPLIDTSNLETIALLVRSTRTVEPTGLFSFFQSPTPAPSPKGDLKLKCKNGDTGKHFEVDLGAQLSAEIPADQKRVNIAAPSDLKKVFSSEITSGRRAAGNPSRIACILEASGSDIHGSIHFLSGGKSEATDFGLTDPTWLDEMSEGDTNVGFEFESYFLQLAIENAGTSEFETKEVAFSGFGFDLTADVKQDKTDGSLFTWYDVEAVTMPFGSDGGVKFCKMAQSVREIYGDIHQKITKGLVDRTIAAAERCAEAGNKKTCFDTEKGALQETVRERDIELSHVKAGKTVKAKALFPSPILLGVGTKNGENTEDVLRIVEKYGVLARPQATFCLHVDRMLDFFMEPIAGEDGFVSYKMRRERFMYAAFNNIANIDNAPRSYKTWRTRTERVMGRVMELSPSQTNVLNFEIKGATRSVTFGPSHDAIKGFIFALRMVLMRLHHPERKGLYTKARMSIMIRTNTVTWWNSIKDDAPNGLDEDVFEALVCNGVSGLYINYGWGFDIDTSTYYKLSSRMHESEILVRVTADIEKDYKTILAALKDGGILEKNYKRISGKPDGSTLKVKRGTVGADSEEALTITVFVKDTDGNFDRTATMETIRAVKETLSNAFPCDEADSSVPKKGSCYPLVEHDDEEIETHASSHSGSCSDWIRGIVGSKGEDSIAESLKGDLSYGYIKKMDTLRDLKGPNEEVEEGVIPSTSPKGVRFEMRGLLSIIGPSSAKGVTVDEFLLEASELTRFGQWLNDPSSRRAAERQAAVEPPNNLHSFWHTGHVRKNLQHPTKLQLEYPNHKIFNEPDVAKLDDELRRTRAKAAADLIFESEDNCQKYFSGGGLRIQLTLENVQSLGLTSAKLKDMMKERCLDNAGTVESPGAFADMSEPEKVAAYVRAIEDCELASKSGGIARLVSKMEERLELALVDWIESVKSEADKAREQFKTQTLSDVRQALDAAHGASKERLANLILKYAASPPLPPSLKKETILGTN